MRVEEGEREMGVGGSVREKEERRTERRKVN